MTKLKFCLTGGKIIKTIKTFENSERLVKLIFNETDNTYTVSILTRDENTGKIYKSKFYAERKFNEYKNHPLNAIKDLK